MALAVTWQNNPPENLLKERFRISTGFHPGQRDIIEQLVQGKRLLVIQRTGWGKSFCYQMAGLYYPHLTLVFSQLKALMRDQCQRCLDFTANDTVREQKLRELSHIQDYAQLRSCYTEYLTTYLGEHAGYHCRTCGKCRASNFPLIRLSERMLNAATRFLEEEFLPRIEKRGIEKRPIHEAGWSLSYHGTTRTGRQVRASKYEDAGPFAKSLISRAVHVVRTRYQLEAVNGIVSVPPIGGAGGKPPDGVRGVPRTPGQGVAAPVNPACQDGCRPENLIITLTAHSDDQ